MHEMERRDFLKLAGAGVGVVAASGLFADRLLAGTMPVSAAAMFDERFGVSKEAMSAVLKAALSKGGDFADLFFEYRISNAVTMEDDIIRQSSENVTLGVGIRVLKGQQTGFGYTSDLTPEKMKQAALTAAAIASGDGKAKLPGLETLKVGHQVYSMAKPVAESPLKSKIELVKAGYEAAKKHDARVGKVVSMLTDELQYVTIATSEGRVVSDVRPQTRFMVMATAESDGVRNTGRHSVGGRVGMAFFSEKGSTPKDVGVAAAKEALLLLEAVDPEPGDQPVVLGNFNSGVMVHEAMGHPLEGDGAWKKSSIMHDRIGQMVASPMVTIYDDATIPNYRGSYNIDDEGMPSKPAMLIEKGKLVDFLHDRLSSQALKVKPNGHGRRQTFANVPIPRMGNTILAPGEHDPEEIIKSVKKGFYAHSYQGGMVQDTGKFTFSVNLGYQIEDGKLTRPLKNATLIGMNMAVLKDVEMVGNDLAFFLGTCGKEGQWQPVTAGTPTFKVRQMTVGGRA